MRRLLQLKHTLRLPFFLMPSNLQEMFWRIPGRLSPEDLRAAADLIKPSGSGKQRRDNRGENGEDDEDNDDKDDDDEDDDDYEDGDDGDEAGGSDKRKKESDRAKALKKMAAERREG